MLSPELVILGGVISNTGDFLLDFIVNEIRDNVLIMDEATLIGAIAYFIEHTDFLAELSI